jgi:flagellar motor switch/type III secretory pathway protein FliN
LRIEDLLDVDVEVAVQFARGNLAAAAFLDLRPGINVPMKTRVGEPALLTVAGSVLARGECGALGERNAMIVK